MKIILSILILVLDLAAWAFLFFIYGFSGNPFNAQFQLLALVPVLFSVPMWFAIFSHSKKWRVIFILSGLVLPLFGSVVAFRHELYYSYQLSSIQREDEKEYQRALSTKDQDPARALLACLAANTWQPKDCGETLEVITDAQFCRNVCNTTTYRHRIRNERCPNVKDEVIFVRIPCAKIMVRKMSPERPYDVCKAAGLANYVSGPAGHVRGDYQGYFQGYYYDCLRSEVLVGNIEGKPVYKELRELLKVKYDWSQSYTKNPLPE